MRARNKKPIFLEAREASTRTWGDQERELENERPRITVDVVDLSVFESKLMVGEKESCLRETDMHEVFEALNTTRLAVPQAETRARSLFSDAHTLERSDDRWDEAAREVE